MEKIESWTAKKRHWNDIFSDAIYVLRSKTTMCRATLKHTLEQMNTNEHTILSVQWIDTGFCAQRLVFVNDCKNWIKTININQFHWFQMPCAHSNAWLFFVSCMQTTIHLRFSSRLSRLLQFFWITCAWITFLLIYPCNATWLAFDYAYAAANCAICLLHFFTLNSL